MAKKARFHSRKGMFDVIKGRSCQRHPIPVTGHPAERQLSERQKRSISISIRRCHETHTLMCMCKCKRDLGLGATSMQSPTALSFPPVAHQFHHAKFTGRILQVPLQDPTPAPQRAANTFYNALCEARTLSIGRLS